jgi:DNA repair exonuclease SbcCD ATPase subunit
MIRNSSLTAIALLLAGCAGLRDLGLPVSEPEERQVIQLIGYAQHIPTLSAEQQRREYSANNQAFVRDKDAMSRMRLSLLLATPGASVYDAARAANLLEPIAATGDTASPLQSLARLLYMQVNERASEQKRTTQMREQIDALKDGDRSARQQLEALKESERTLRQQLEALKEVERSIMQRGQDSPPRRK